MFVKENPDRKKKKKKKVCCRDKLRKLHNYLKEPTFRISRREVLLKEVVLKLCSKFTGEHTCRSVISIKAVKQLY